MSQGLSLFIFTILAGLSAPSVAQVSSARDISRYSPQCKIQVLNQLGWITTSGEQVQQTVTADPCSAMSLQDIRAKQILALEVPQSFDADQIAKLDQALQGSASLCAYKTYYNAALNKAVHGLDDNLWYSFDMKFISSDTIRLGGVKGWQKMSCASDNIATAAKDACYEPTSGQIETAFQSLMHASYASECDTGLQLAEYSAIHELFGARTSQYFTPAELFIGNWFNVKQSQSVIHGTTGRRVNDPHGIGYSNQGYQMLTGVPGYIGSAIADESLLDDKTNRNENFIVVQTTPVGQAELKKHGGLSYYEFLMKQIWTMSHAFNRQQLNMIGHHHRLPEGSPDDRQIQAALQDPFLKDTILYIKGVGFSPIADVIVRLAQVNPRMPYGIAFDPEATHAEIFDRWLRSRLDLCQ